MTKNVDSIEFNTDVERNPINYSAWPYNKMIADTTGSWVYANPNSYSIVPIPIVDTVRGNLFIGDRKDDSIFEIIYHYWDYILNNIFYIHFKRIFTRYIIMAGLREEFASKSDEEKEYIGWKMLYPYMQVNKIELFKEPLYNDDVRSLMFTTSFEHYVFNRIGSNLLLYTRLDINYSPYDFGMSEEDVFDFSDVGYRYITKNFSEPYYYSDFYN